eukprot:CAMPEP_0201598488 /NCGR_PEP_ID=MMETSP0492-20130828/281_1 /ASSEMBLY_ACC=CAM_ASM_000837 /TAXON_ID=420259 /ORGANISM="Thalassiosira gravida, Strain GMp14c1" /LENGTH=528 /DNA_ID=CAMNT_0048060905 /DNA_START=61 /DNA_END=1647 /DNA_ORIENTATION=-
MTSSSKELECDYLVVGAGAAPMAFIDTLLTELPDSKVILIDKKAAPGGHWVDAYGFVRLHQPSIVYGISSQQLEGNWLKLLLTKLTLPWKHRASKKEMLTYFGNFVDKKVASKQLDFYPNSIYKFETKGKVDQDGIHYFSSVDGSMSYKVKVNSKLVDGTRGECIIPHDSPLQFPVDEGVRVMTPNQIYDTHQEKGDKRSVMLKNKYVVLGAGKTGMDAIVYLQRKMKIDPVNIAWVIPNDVWMFNGSAGGRPWDFPESMAKCSNDIDKASFSLEKEGKLVRLDKNITPTRFRFPVTQLNELKLLRKVKTIIRRGRATAIRRKNNSHVTVEFESNHPPWDGFAPIETCIFVHATSPGPSNDRFDSMGGEDIFGSSRNMTLHLIFLPPVSFSMSCLAKIEAARVKGTLDTGVMRRLALAFGEEKTAGSDFTDDDLLKILIKRVSPSGNDIHRGTINQVLLLAFIDRDPMVPLKWMKQNRLSFLSIPGVKADSCNHVRMLRSKGTTLGLPENHVRMLDVLGEKIVPLEGM